MGIFDSIKDAASGLVNEHGDQVTDAVDSATDAIDDKTDGKLSMVTDKVDEAAADAVDGLKSD